MTLKRGETPTGLGQKISDFFENSQDSWAVIAQAWLAALAAALTCLALANLIFPDLFPRYEKAIVIFEWVAFSSFAVEYAVRFLASWKQAGYIRRFSSVADALSFFPSLVLLTMGYSAAALTLGFVRLFWLVRTLKLFENLRTRIRTKIFIAFAGSTLIILAPTLIFIYSYFTKIKENDIRHTMIGIVVSLSKVFTAEDFLEIQSETDAAYLKLQETLQLVRDELRQSGIPVRYVYTMRKDASNPAKLIYIVDAEQDPRKHSPLGSIWDSVANDSPWSTNFSKAQVAPTFDFDDDGKTLILSAWGPLPYNREAWEESPVIIVVDLLAQDVQEQKRTIGALVLVLLGSATLIVSVISVLISIYFNRPIVELTKGIEAFEKCDFGYRVKVLSGDELGRLGEMFNSRLFLMMRDFFQFMYAPVAQMLMGAQRQSLLEGKYEHVSVLYTDFKGFTSKSSLYSPRQVVEFLNTAFAILEGAVSDYEGVIDKHIGDALMVYFIPLEGESNTARRAVECAMTMQERYEGLYKGRISSGELVCELRVGVNSGDAILGALGSLKLEVTVIGNTVNMANRMESAAPIGGVGLSVATFTQSLLSHWIGERAGWSVKETKQEVKHISSIQVYWLTNEHSAQKQLS
ncbi:MAG: adenylate/guanylate cyclase domain-containing protein [Deltaproteobacteria bacterium]